MIKCPICDCTKVNDLIIDLVICNKCSHIFKKEMHDYDNISITDLHMFKTPVESLRTYLESHKDGIEFTFPSMMFYELELEPSKFYEDKTNNYFNQMSLMILFKRCGLIPVEQKNEWLGKMCITHIKVIPEGKK